jgi:hypothetical protein
VNFRNKNKNKKMSLETEVKKINSAISKAIDYYPHFIKTYRNKKRYLYKLCKKDKRFYLHYFYTYFLT